MRKSLPIAIFCCVLLSLQSRATHKIFYLLPEFRFEYDPGAYDVDAFESNIALSGKEPENELYVKSKTGKGPSMHIVTSYAGYPSGIDGFSSTSPQYYSVYQTERYRYPKPVDYELSREYITIHGLTFTVIKYLNEACGREGKYSNYYYTLDLDTTFHSFSKLTVHYESWQGREHELPVKRKVIDHLLQFFNGFSLVPYTQVMMNSEQLTSEQLKSEYEETVRIYQKTFRRKIKRTFRRDTTGISLSENCANFLTPEQIKFYRKQDNYQLVEDSIFAVRKHYADRELNLFLDVYSRFNYSRNNEAHLLKKLANNNFPYDYYLNTFENETNHIRNSLDTLHKRMAISHADPYLLYTHWLYDGHYRIGWYSENDWDTINRFETLMIERTYAQFVPDLMRKLYAEDLKCTNPDFYPYQELIDQPDVKSFMVFNPAQYHQSEILLATFRKTGSNWRLDIDTLPSGIRYKGRERLREFGDYFLFEQRDSIYLLDCSKEIIAMMPLPFTGDSLDNYIFSCKEFVFGGPNMLEPTQCQFQRDRIENNTIDDMWNLLVRDKKIMVDNEYNPCYSCINLNHGDSLVQPATYYSYARMTIPAELACYRSGYKIRDLDGDGSDEMFCYTVSNGELKEWTCYGLQEGRVTSLEPSQARALIEQDGDCINLKAFSRIGKRSKQIIQAE